MDSSPALGLTEEQLSLGADDVFDIVAKIGSGSYGDVYKAVDKQFGRPYAVKKISSNTDLREIVKEVSMMQECDSPYIVRYFASFSSSTSLWIVMEYCGIGSVSDMMKVMQKPLPESAIGAVLADAIRGLSYLHERRRIHRDVKAGNILLTETGRAKIADFGVAGKLSETLKKFDTMIGSPLWMAPEVLGEAGYELPADIWSLGITAIEMAEGKPPLHELHPIKAIFAIPNQDPPRLADPEQWSKEFIDFVADCLQKEPSKRPTANDLLSNSPFITAYPAEAERPQCLKKLIEECLSIREQIYRDSLAAQSRHSFIVRPSVVDIEFAPRQSAPAAICSNDELQNSAAPGSGPSSRTSYFTDDQMACPTRPFSSADLNFEFLQNLPIDQLKRSIEEYDQVVQAERAWLRHRYELKRLPILNAIARLQQSAIMPKDPSDNNLSNELHHSQSSSNFINN